MLSAHWEERPITLGATTTVPLVYDFYGFPTRYYEQHYPAPGAPELAKRIHKTLEPIDRVVDEPGRGLDHGAYVPLVAMYPHADVPTLQASLPSMDPDELFAFGRKLAPLRDEGVLIVGSGNVVHNLRLIGWGGGAPYDWATRFNDYVREAIATKQYDRLIDYHRAGADARLAVPTPEHYLPLLYVLGAQREDESVHVAIDGIEIRSIGMLSAWIDGVERPTG